VISRLRPQPGAASGLLDLSAAIAKTCARSPASAFAGANRDNPDMRFLIDFFPIALFVAAYKMHDIYTATAVLMAATVVQTGLIYAVDRKLQTLHKVTLLLVLVFGALTLFLQDERFIKWKPTVLYASLAIVLGAALWVWKKNLLQLLLGSQLQLPGFVWTRLTVIWIAYFLFMASINAYVAAFFSTDFWVDFKIWGYAFPVLFIVGQGLYIARYLKDEPAGDQAGKP
jgi:intracellular septation protein